MDYADFKTEYKKVFDAIDGDRPSADFAPDVARQSTTTAPAPARST
jgi:hypothetical protein